MIFVTPSKSLYGAYVSYCSAIAAADSAFRTSNASDKDQQRKKRKDILHIIYRQMNLNYDCAKYIYKHTHTQKSLSYSALEEYGGGMGVGGSKSNTYSPLKQAEQHTE